jgi:hypothetical protein
MHPLANVDAETLKSRAVAAAVAVARAHGIECNDPSVLADGSNVLLHLRPAPVVARVATTTAQMRPDAEEFLRREVALGEHLARQGAPIVTPSDLLPPGPHTHDGLSMSFWRFVEHRVGVRPDVVDVAPTLAQLHAALRSFSGPLPLLNPVLGELPRVLTSLEQERVLENNDVVMLKHLLTRLESKLRAQTWSLQPLHGDAHTSNVLIANDGRFLWSDFEDCCLGPVGWDLACLVRSWPQHREAALAAYGAAPEGLELCLDARQLQAVCWQAVYSRRRPEARAKADELLRYWRARTDNF